MENPLFFQASMSAAAATSSSRCMRNHRITRRRSRSVRAARSVGPAGTPAGRHALRRRQPARARRRSLESRRCTWWLRAEPKRWRVRYRRVAGGRMRGWRGHSCRLPAARLPQGSLRQDAHRTGKNGAPSAADKRCCPPGVWRLCETRGYATPALSAAHETSGSPRPKDVLPQRPGFPSTRVSGSRSSTATCRAISARSHAPSRPDPWPGCSTDAAGTA